MLPRMVSQASSVPEITESAVTSEEAPGQPSSEAYVPPEPDTGTSGSKPHMLHFPPSNFGVMQPMQRFCSLTVI